MEPGWRPLFPLLLLFKEIHPQPLRPHPMELKRQPQQFQQLHTARLGLPHHMEHTAAVQQLEHQGPPPALMVLQEQSPMVQTESQGQLVVQPHTESNLRHMDQPGHMVLAAVLVQVEQPVQLMELLDLQELCHQLDQAHLVFARVDLPTVTVEVVIASKLKSSEADGLLI